MTQELFEYYHPATGCARCPALAAERHTVVWGKGPPQADLMMIGEAPGYNEDMKGLPFVGQAGRELDTLLREADIDPFEVHIANRIMCRPPGNRDPEPQEMINCEPWLTEHIRMVNPKGIVLFGRAAVSWKFDKHTIAQTQGLMVRKDCDACGESPDSHRYRFAVDGIWGDDSLPCESGAYVRKRVLSSIYHPAATFRDRNPEYKPHIVRELRRLVEEMAWL